MWNEPRTLCVRMCACVCACVLVAKLDAARLAHIHTNLAPWHEYAVHTASTRHKRSISGAPFAHIVIFERFGLLIPLGLPLAFWVN